MNACAPLTSAYLRVANLFHRLTNSFESQLIVFLDLCGDFPLRQLLNGFSSFKIEDQINDHTMRSVLNFPPLDLDLKNLSGELTFSRDYFDSVRT